MSRIVISTMAAVIAAAAFGGMSVGSASAASEPLFILQGGGAMLRHGVGGPVSGTELRNGMPVHVHCNQELWDGYVQPGSPNIHRVSIQWEGNCQLLVNGTSTSCTEPLNYRGPILNVLGLVSPTNHEVAIFALPSSGTEMADFTCGEHEFKLEGDVVGEIPEVNAKGVHQYNKLLSALEIVYAEVGETEKQKLTEIFLSGAEMEKIELKSGTAAASIKATETLEGEGLLEIDTE